MPTPPNPPPFPLALPAPAGPVTVIGRSQVDEAVAQSRRSPRGRIILPFHPAPGDTLHRMLNAIQPASYVQPHRHSHPPKAESIIVLQGAIGCAIFSDHGDVEQLHVLGAGRASFGIDIHAGVFHTFFALEPDTVVFEVKQGPYEKSSDKDFAPWAPKEGTPEAKAYLDRLQLRRDGA
ncbi:MAG TPA: WbuC family cupin fold metalloprotein [Lacunisphaera sp.]|nr:WbuC family cupin fold metalloprotein [Lacunisphaera sp.]